MLDECAPGHERSLGKGGHNYRILFGGKTATFPKGAHGKKPGQAEVRIGKVRGLIRRLEIEDCGRAFFGL